MQTMTPLNSGLKFIIDLSKAQTLLSRRFDAKLSPHGLGFNDFIILYHLSQAPGEKLRRVDLADTIGLTASGVTRMLEPMEKSGFVLREKNERDARVSFVVLAPGGKRILKEATKTAIYAAEEISASKTKQFEKLSGLFNEMGGLL